MGFVAVPITFPYSLAHDRLAGIGAAGGMRIHMTNPHPQPIPLTVIPADSLLMEEIRILRERGLTDECIHGLFSGFNIDANPEPSGQHWKLPANDQLIRLIWGKALLTPVHLD